MTKKQFINFVLKEKRIPKAKWKSIFKKTLLLLFLAFCLFFISAEIYYFYESGANNIPWSDLYILVLTSIFVVAILFHIKVEWNFDNNFMEIENEFNSSENFERMVKLIKIFKIRRIETDKKNGFISFVTKPTWLTWGDKITIICDDNRILVNSRAIGTQLISFGRQKQNLEKLKQLAAKE